MSFLKGGFLFSTFLLFISCSSGENDPAVAEGEVPALVSSVPSDGTKDLSVGEITIILTYDQNITLVNPHEIKINGNDVESASAAFKELTVKAILGKGTIYTLTIPSGKVKGPTGLLAAQVSISFQTKSPVSYDIPSTLVTLSVMPQTQNVYNFLRENYGKKLISGTMANVNWNINEAEWMYKHTGKYPALNAFDFVHLYASPANWIDYGNTTVIENWWNNNGLVAATWHWNVPQSEGSSNYGFYYTGKNNGTGETSFDVTKAVQNGTSENLRVKADLNKIADYLLLLKAKNIPVIWRPMHEASGGWFWWGAKGATPFKALWKLMFDTFKEKGVNNLIWVWTAQTGDNEWYPGNEYVDIIGCDIYNKTVISQLTDEYTSLVQTYPNKIITLSECGNVANMSLQWNAGATWSWFMPWYDYDRTKDVSALAFNETIHQYANITWWTNVLNQSVILTRDQMPNLK